MRSIQSAEAIYQAVQKKIDAIMKASAIEKWRFRINPPQGAYAPDFDDSDWETVKLSHTWSSADGEAWFRTTLNLPAEVEGIPLAGSTLELIIALTIGASIYVNGEEMYREPSWSDTRAVPLVLTEDYQPGSPWTLAIRCNAGDGFGAFIAAYLRFSSLADIAFRLDLARMQMAFTRFLVEQGDGASPEKMAAWERAAAALDLEALEDNDWNRWWASVEAAQAALSPFADEAKRYTTHLIAHSHIDMNWLWPWSETVEVCRRDFTTVDQLMDRYPEFHFSQSQASTYHAMETYHPNVFDRIRARVGEGRWDITATTWVEGDLNMAAGESLVRQILHTRRYIRSHFGVEPLICWEPDTFGHPATYPQILKKSGVQFYYFCRAGKRHPLFWWEGLDGSRVLAVQDPRGYSGTIEVWETPGVSSVVESVMDFSSRYKIHRGLYVYGAGDHGGGATARDIEAARVIDATPFLPRARCSSTVAFYQEALAESPELPVVRGELNTVFEGCYTTHGDIKRMNRDGENGLLTAETTATLGAILAGASYPLDELAEAWRTLCFHQFHDILCGCAIGVTYREARERMARVMEVARQTTADALATLVSAVDTGAGEGPRVVVFNPLAWERDDVVRVPLSELGDITPTAVEDDQGRRLPAQVCGDELVFVAEGLPSLGVRVYRPVSEPADEEATVRVDLQENVLDNGILRIRVHPASGALDQLIDLEVDRNLAGPLAGWGPEAKVSAGMLNRMQILWEQPHPMSAWNIGEITRVDHLITGAQVQVVEQGPVRGVIEVRRQFLNSSLRQRIVLYRGLRRIDFETEVDWHERGSAHQDAPMLRVIFSPFLEYTRATFEIPFAGLERPADGREVPALRWADLSEDNYGVSLLNDGKYGHQAHGNTLGLTLLRASYEPDNNPDEGLHRFTYALYPHPGDWREAGTEQRAAELNQPVLVAVTDGHIGPLQPGRPWLRCDSDHARVSAVKLAEDQPEKGMAVIVRVYEAHGRETNVRLQPRWPVARAEEVDPVERPLADLAIEEGSISLHLTPHEIKTVKLYTA